MFLDAESWSRNRRRKGGQNSHLEYRRFFLRFCQDGCCDQFIHQLSTVLLLRDNFQKGIDQVISTDKGSSLSDIILKIIRICKRNICNLHRIPNMKIDNRAKRMLQRQMNLYLFPTRHKVVHNGGPPKL